jgi:hypothetical protein
MFQLFQWLNSSSNAFASFKSNALRPPPPFSIQHTLVFETGDLLGRIAEHVVHHLVGILP